MARSGGGRPWITGSWRTTFREAIRELAAEGLLTVVAQKGARVSAPSLEEAIDLYEVRAALECIVVTRFVERSHDREIRSLKTAVKNFRRASTRPTDILELLRAKEPFYDVLVRGGRSNALQQLLEGIKARVHALRATLLSQPGSEFISIRGTWGPHWETVLELGPAATHLYVKGLKLHIENGY